MSNCLIFALFQWLHYGGYIVVRRSKHGWWPHFMWAKDIKDLEIVEYIPHKEIDWADKWQIPPPIFKGYVRQGFDERAD